LTTGRTEITARDDKVNEAARIEACATEGRSLASKQLQERLDETDAGALALVVEHLQYIPLGELPHVPDKARRDAPTIAVANL
jgi:class 3 adenylate cyclase